jgi:hypothetical protein
LLEEGGKRRIRIIWILRFEVRGEVIHPFGQCNGCIRVAWDQIRPRRRAAVDALCDIYFGNEIEMCFCGLGLRVVSVGKC